METNIGATLREARGRRQLELHEVEAAIKIRARFLRAIENEEWDVLPGGAYTRGFIRTYANYLGLDGDRIAEDFRRSSGEAAGERMPRRVEPVPAASPNGGGGGFPLKATLAVLAALAVVAAIAIGIGDDDGGGQPEPTPQRDAQPTRQQPAPAPQPRPGVEVSLRAEGEVWVCLLGDGEELVDGAILAPGESAGPFRARSFEAAFGNGAVAVLVEGDGAEVEETSSPIGYEIGADGDLTQLEEGERPSCE